MFNFQISLLNVLTYFFIFLNIFAASDFVGRRKPLALREKCKTSDDGKIVGGEEVSITDYPYQVRIKIYVPGGLFVCGGSIIGKNHVLTAAHCLDGASKVKIRAGSNNSESGGQMYRSKDLIVHPQYNDVTFDYDIGIVQLKDPMELDGVTTRAVQLPDADFILEPRSNLNVSGWGRLIEGGPTTTKLMAVTVPTTSDEYCRKAYAKVTPRMICAGSEEGGKDACQGDSGGPAVHNNLQIGITSWGDGCAKPGKPGVYVRVTALREWIREKTGI